MPKIVDHQQRRAELAQAVWRVIERDGIGHASVRTVAAESGWSTGSLRHYFPTQDALLSFAMELCFSRLRERIETLEATGDHLARARRLAELILPLDSERLITAKVLLAFMPRAVVNPTLHVEERAGTGALIRAFSELFEQARRDGQWHEPADPEREAKHLVALLDGLNTHHILEPHSLPADEITAIVDEHLAARLPSARAG